MFVTPYTDGVMGKHGEPPNEIHHAEEASQE